ncbi:hypothetical protein WME97_21305 [Sorangium sp. So ce367]|uniref:hypothetical protein n=1 Tax=Sorangium sp. So ce367 TaxID=3133305 RepID=UPI003F625806
MTYPCQWWILAMALGLLAGCSGERVRDFSDGGTAGGCGDGVKGGEEQCDGSDLGGATCTSIMGAGYFLPSRKTLACTNDCAIDTSACTNACILDAPASMLDSCVLQ